MTNSISLLKKLLEREVIFKEDLEEIFGKRKFGQENNDIPEVGTVGTIPSADSVGSIEATPSASDIQIPRLDDTPRNEEPKEETDSSKSE